MESYETLRRVGRGHHGTVWLVRDMRDGRLYCLKTINLQAYNEAERAQAAGEVSLLRSLDHPCIVRYREHFLDKDGSLCLVMTFCEGGDLASVIRAQRESGTHFSEAQVLDWFAQLALALGHTHERRILHRDLKTQNVFLTRAHLVKLGDYGIARLLDGSHEQAQTVVGTPFYMSPEVCQNRPYSYKSDVWALGCVLYELLALRQAWDGSNLLGLVYKIVQQTHEPPPSHYSAELRALLAAMLAKDPDDRPSVGEILQEPIVRQAVQAIAVREPARAQVAPPQLPPACALVGGPGGGSPDATSPTPSAASALTSAATPGAGSSRVLGLARVRRPLSGGLALLGRGAARGALVGAAGSPLVGSTPPPPPQPARAASACAAYAVGASCGTATSDGSARDSSARSPADGDDATAISLAHTPRSANVASLTPAQRMRARKLAVADEAASQLAAAAAEQRASTDAAARLGRLQFETSSQRQATLLATRAHETQQPAAHDEASHAGAGAPLGADTPLDAPALAGGGSCAASGAAARAPSRRASANLQQLPHVQALQQAVRAQTPVCGAEATGGGSSPSSPLSPQPLGGRARDACTPSRGDACNASEYSDDFEEDLGAEAKAKGDTRAGAEAGAEVGPLPSRAHARSRAGVRSVARLSVAVHAAAADEDSERLAQLAAAQLHTPPPQRKPAVAVGAATAADETSAQPARSASIDETPLLPPDDAPLPPRNGFEPRHSAAERAVALHARCEKTLGEAFAPVYTLLRSRHERQDSSDVRPALVAIVGRERLSECFCVDQLIFQELLASSAAGNVG